MSRLSKLKIHFSELSEDEQLNVIRRIRENRRKAIQNEKNKPSKTKSSGRKKATKKPTDIKQEISNLSQKQAQELLKKLTQK